MAPKSSTGSGKPGTQVQSKQSSRKATKKQPLSVPERLKRLFNSLCAQIDGGHFTNAIRTCDKILRLEPNDMDALQTKLFLLLQTEQYAQSLDLISQVDKSSSFSFEQAYSLYRLQHEDEAQQVLDSIKPQAEHDHRGVLHLEAQLNYRQGQYQEAFDLYSQLLDTAEPQSEEHSDILTNLRASQKHLDFINTEFLHALDTLPAALISTLETTPPPTQSMVAATLTASVPQTLTDEKAESAPKKVRKTRVPAGVVPGVTPPPDPERWLKKSERSTYGQGRRKKTGGGATQGSTSVDSSQVGTASGQTGRSGSSKGKKKK